MLLITGDKHGTTEWLNKLKDINSQDTSIIILGDTGLNFDFKSIDKIKKKIYRNFGFDFYLVRGNHEIRPENVPTIKKVWDFPTNNYVYWEEEFPNIRYMIDGYIYTFNNKTVLPIGGAYSVDKDYRISRNWPWFADEQLSAIEMKNIEDNIKDKQVDIVVSHTCPISWQPVDLFLPYIDQKLVDNTMENWLEELKDKFVWDKWYFGHYHTDRQIASQVKIVYNDIIEV